MTFAEASASTPVHPQWTHSDGIYPTFAEPVS